MCEIREMSSREARERWREGNAYEVEITDYHS